METTNFIHKDSNLETQNSNNPNENKTQFLYFNNNREKFSSVYVTIKQFDEAIKTGEPFIRCFRESIENLRSYCANVSDFSTLSDEDDKQIKTFKDSLPAVMPSCLTSGSRKKTDFLNHTGIIQIDID